MPFAWTLHKMNKAKTRSIRIAAWDHAMGLLQGIAAFASQTPTEDQLKLQERLQTLCDMRVPADAVIEVAELILLARKIGRAEEADALVAGDRVDVITDTQRMDFQQANPHMYFNVDKRGKRWRFGHFSNYPQDCYGSAREALDAAIQAQKDGQ